MGKMVLCVHWLCLFRAPATHGHTVPLCKWMNWGRLSAAKRLGQRTLRMTDRQTALFVNIPFVTVFDKTQRFSVLTVQRSIEFGSRV